MSLMGTSTPSFWNDHSDTTLPVSISVWNRLVELRGLSMFILVSPPMRMALLGVSVGVSVGVRGPARGGGVTLKTTPASSTPPATLRITSIWLSRMR